MKKNTVILLLAFIILTGAILLLIVVPTVHKYLNRSLRDNMKLVASFKADDHMPTYKYRSEKSGLTVVINDVEGPIVSGHFCLATQACDDDGLPHALEHLIFHGSENYPYKGVLELLAKRCLSSGTNAWTSVDHTCYIMSTTGSDGFLSLMPIFLDHILYPTLRNYSFTTEVHHISGTGEDGGVVYSEMQGRENRGEMRANSELFQLLYPEECGYKRETGGKMKNLRESTNMFKLRQYHKKYYRPENLIIIIGGTINHDDVFTALNGLEEKILSKKKQKSFQSPWLSQLSHLDRSFEKTIMYPANDESASIVNIGWRGPSLINEIYTVTATQMLCQFMVQTSASILRKKLIEIEDPFASAVYCHVTPFSDVTIEISFSNVPINKTDRVKPELNNVLRSFYNNAGLNIEELRTLIQKKIIQTLNQFENLPQYYVNNHIKHFLFGNSDQDLENRLNVINRLRKLKTEPEEFWFNVMKKYFIDVHRVTIKARPSAEEKKRLVEEEKNRINERVQILGEEGLKRKQRELEEAQKQTHISPPLDLLQSIDIPDTDSVAFYNITQYTTNGIEQPSQFDLHKVPVYTYLDNTNTHFIYMTIFMDMTSLTPELRYYLTLFREAILESPIRRGNVLIPYEEVVKELDADTINKGFGLGLNGFTRFSTGQYEQTAVFKMQLEVDKYIKGIFLLNEILYNTVFTADRLKIIATKIINAVPQEKRDPYTIIFDLIEDIYYNKTSVNHCSKMLRQHRFLTSVIKKLDDGNANTVIENLNKVRKVLTNPSNMALHIAVNLDTLSKKYPDPAAPWSKLLPSRIVPLKRRLRITPDYKLHFNQLSAMNPSCIVGLSATESSYFTQSVSSITDYNDPNLPALLVFLEYLQQTEGTMWKQIRGKGFAYGFYMSVNPRLGLLNLFISRATNVVEAYKVAKQVVEFQINSTEWDSSLLESAKIALITNKINEEGVSISHVIEQSIGSYFKGIGKDYYRNMISSIKRVTIDDLKEVGEIYVSPLFDYDLSKAVCVCSSDKIRDIADKFKEINLNLKVYSTIEESYLNQF